jgi:hypothetical protein
LIRRKAMSGMALSTIGGLRRPLTLAIGLVGIVLAAIGGYIPSAQADGGFSNRSMAGSWGFSSIATVVPPATPAQTPAAAVGIMTFDGLGGCSISETFNAGGFSGSQTSTSCSYSVNPDGSGTLSAQTPGGPVAVSFVLVADKSEFRLIRTDLIVARGVAKRQ